MQVKEVMTADPACCISETGLQEVAQMMIDHDCGEIPVVESKETKRSNHRSRYRLPRDCSWT
jgi:CBS domain-containing protein